MNRLSDRGSIPLSSTYEKLLKSSVLAVFLRAKMGYDQTEKRLYRAYMTIDHVILLRAVEGTVVNQLLING